MAEVSVSGGLTVVSYVHTCLSFVIFFSEISLGLLLLQNVGLDNKPSYSIFKSSIIVSCKMYSDTTNQII